MSTARDPQTSLRSDWQRLLRQAALNTDSPEAIEVCNTLLWLSTYANADGTNAHPGVETIRHLKGCSYDRASTMLAVGCELGLLMRQRRPNDTTVYRLMIPVILPLRWEDSPAFAKLTNSRHKQRHAKAREEKRRTVSAPTVRTMSAPGVPKSPSRPRTMSARTPGPWAPHRFRTMSAPGGYIHQLLPRTVRWMRSSHSNPSARTKTRTSRRCTR